MTAYYNEFDPYAAAWLRNLIQAGLIAPGDVDERSIVDVRPDDLRGYTQVHFFAGIGGWSLAARLAGYPDDRELWTGSCPCQPFSAAGKRKGTADERHPWPEFFRLISACRPRVVVGEQVASKDGLAWLDGDADLLRMRDIKTLDRFLRELEGRAAQDLRSLLRRERGSAKGPQTEGGTSSIVGQVPPGAAGAATFVCGEVQGEGEEVGVRFGCGGRGTSSSDHRRGLLPDDGPTVRFGQGQDVEHAVYRPDRPEGGLRKGERARDFVRLERDDEHLGRSEGARSGAGLEWAKSRGVEGVSSANGRCLETPTEPIHLVGVRPDLEGAGYTVWAGDYCAAGVGAPHIRQRLWWLADANGGHAGAERQQPGGQHGLQPQDGGAGAGVGHASNTRLEGGDTRTLGDERSAAERAGAVLDGGLADADQQQLDGSGNAGPGGRREFADDGCVGFWSDYELIPCRDGTARRTKPGIFPLAHGVPGRVGKLRAAGNAIVPQVAAEILRAYLEGSESL